jgi:hypothetical protein
VKRLEEMDDQAIHQRIEAQVQVADVAVIGLTGSWLRVSLIVHDSRATRRTTPGHEQCGL